MVTSIIPLPNFHNVDPSVSTILSQMMDSSIDTGMHESYDIHLSLGRNIVLTRPIYKYKLTLANVHKDLLDDTSRFLHSPGSYCIESEIIFLSTDPLDVVGYNFSPSTTIFPIYGRYGGNRVLFIDGINRLFVYLGLPNKVESTLEFIHSVVQYCSSGAVYSDYSVRNFSRYDRNDTFSEIIDALNFNNGADNQRYLNDFVKQYDSFSFLFSQEFLYLSSINSPSMLLNHINKYADQTDALKAAVLRSMPTWEQQGKDLARLKRILITTIELKQPCDTYIGSLMGRALSSIYSILRDDWSMTFNPNEAIIADVYTRGFEKTMGFTPYGFNMESNGAAILGALSQATGLGVYTEPLTVHKTMTEDLLISNSSTGEILLYIDLVWWTIAAANGLINASNSFNLL